MNHLTKKKMGDISICNEKSFINAVLILCLWIDYMGYIIFERELKMFGSTLCAQNLM